MLESEFFYVSEELRGLNPPVSRWVQLGGLVFVAHQSWALGSLENALNYVWMDISPTLLRMMPAHSIPGAARMVGIGVCYLGCTPAGEARLLSSSFASWECCKRTRAGLRIESLWHKVTSQALPGALRAICLIREQEVPPLGWKA